MAKLNKMGNGLVLYIPQDITRELGWKAGQEVFIQPEPYNRKIIIKEFSTKQ